jgi:antitoxin HigA-1
MSKSSTITEGRNGRPIRIRPPIHPGELLLEEFLQPLGMKPYTLAKKLHVSRSRVERLVRGETPLSVDMALRLGRFFGSSPEFWMNMQVSYDLTVAEDAEDTAIAAIEPLPREAA